MQLFFFNEIIRLENEVVISKIIFGMVHGQPYKGFHKPPHILDPNTHHSNKMHFQF
jgi:hypothetical protein